MNAPTFLVVLWLIAFAAASIFVCPLMLVSGIPALTMLAFFAPCLWVLASVVLYIAWADSGWREEWEQPAPSLPVRTAGACPPPHYPRIC